MIIILYEQYNIWKNEYHRHSVKRLNSDNLAIEAYAKKKISIKGKFFDSLFETEL